VCEHCFKQSCNDNIFKEHKDWKSAHVHKLYYNLKKWILLIKMDIMDLSIQVSYYITKDKAQDAMRDYRKKDSIPIKLYVFVIFNKN
jgi:hypothetical protein